MRKLRSYEGVFLLFLQEKVRTPFWDAFMRCMTSLADAGKFPIFICIVMLCTKTYRRVGLVTALSLILEAIIVNGTLKPIFRRKRPFNKHQRLTCITRIPQDFSFPSGHTACCFAVASVFIIHMPLFYAIPMLFISVCVGISRMYLGVHYPTDVVGGMLVGFITGLAANHLIHYLVLF